MTMQRNGGAVDCVSSVMTHQTSNDKRDDRGKLAHGRRLVGPRGENGGHCM